MRDHFIAHSLSMPTPRLYYIHDPMCSWCYAFRSSFDALRTDLPQPVRLIYLLGGLAPDSATPMPDAMRQTIQQTWRRIEQTVPNVRFNFEFWAFNTPIRSTYPACRALLAARKQSSDYEIPMLKAIQSAYYERAKNPSLTDTLLECAAEIGLDTGLFGKDLLSPAIEHELQQEIQLAGSMGVSSYPSLRLLHNDKLFAIRIDYLDHRAILEEIAGILQAV